MTTQQLVRIAAGVVLTLCVVALAGRLSTLPAAQPQDNGNDDEERLVRIGYAIAPVPLNLEGKIGGLVGLCSLCLSGCLSRARYVGESAEDDPNLLGRAEATG